MSKKILALIIVILVSGLSLVFIFYLKQGTIDSDGDGLTDIYEQYVGTDPYKIDSDYDGLSDGYEIQHNSDPVYHPNLDTDSDGLTNEDELLLGTDIINNDSDGDFISDGLEVNKYGSNPLRIDSDDGGLDDFNEIYTYPHYKMDPNNPQDDLEIINLLPNVTARHWELNDGEVGGYTLEKYSQISSRDLLIKWLVDHSEIEWSNGSTKIGTIKVNGENIHMLYEMHGQHIKQPSYYFSSGRRGICADSALVNNVILRLMGYQVKMLSCAMDGDDNINHGYNEAVIDGEVRVVNYNSIHPRDWFYEERGWAMSSDYDPDWYKK